MIAIEINTIFECLECGFLMHFKQFFSVQELLKKFGKERWGFHIYSYSAIQSVKWFLGKYTFWVIFFLSSRDKLIKNVSVKQGLLQHGLQSVARFLMTSSKHIIT